MRKYIIKRLFLAVIIFFFVMLIIYTLMRCLPTRARQIPAARLQEL